MATARRLNASNRPFLRDTNSIRGGADRVSVVKKKKKTKYKGLHLAVIPIKRRVRRAHRMHKSRAMTWIDGKWMIRNDSVNRFMSVWLL